MPNPTPHPPDDPIPPQEHPARAATRLRRLAYAETLFGLVLITLLQTAPHALARQLCNQIQLPPLSLPISKLANHMTLAVLAVLIAPAAAMILASPAVRARNRPATVISLTLVTTQAAAMALLAVQQLIAISPDITPARLTTTVLVFATPLCVTAHTAHLLATAGRGRDTATTDQTQTPITNH